MSELPEDLFNSYMENEELLPSLADKTVAITGTTTGLGHALARCAIVKNAALVLLLNRKSERSEKSEKDLHKYIDDDGSNKTVIKTIDCDLMSFDSVKKAAEEVNQEVKSYGGLDVLCLNAGIMAQDDNRTQDGFEVQMQTNQLSHFLLTSLVFSSVKDAADKRGEARIVSQSSSAREFPKVLKAKYFEKCDAGTLGGNDAWMLSQMVLGKGGPWARYGQTKLANSAFAMALHHKLAKSNPKIKSVCCEPGYSITPLQNTKHMPGGRLSSMIPKQSASDGSLNAAMACFSPEAKSGDLYAPEKKMTGKPIKVVAGGERQKTGVIGATDKTTCDPQQQKLVWEACEKALGIEFAV
eukprot:CAMPEP_0172301954 /NCGR_PEP_ID=MMETSP1058-20130122/3754_1 /TAXON_ID=83371 /ORGANISM="Detonula confervacea, Strain CCMP 353" /LENGTH=353 /DNA_ID=CAMNT_0013012277 /DNA_START=82 /DNA_END=1143 /DNA_ORIENTATION=+